MIFVTIGTQQQSFDRLFDYVNEYETKEEIIVQKGRSNYKFRGGIVTYDYLSYEEMEKYFKEARVIITHGGAGTIFKALKMGKKVIVVPRMKKFKEHINDHQVDICKYLNDENYCVMVTCYKEFKQAMDNIKKKKFKKYINHEDDFINNVKEKIDELLVK